MAVSLVQRAAAISVQKAVASFFQLESGFVDYLFFGDVIADAVDVEPASSGWRRFVSNVDTFVLS